VTVFVGSIPAFALAGYVPGAADDWDMVLDALRGLTGAQTAYTPAWSSTGTQPALGDGTLTGFYLQSDKWIAMQTFLTIGSTSTFGTGFYQISLPKTPVRSGQLLIAQVLDSSASSIRWSGAACITSVGTVGMRISVSDGALVGATVPITFATGDQLIISGVYEGDGS
jgi:hypothetical protein